MQRFPVFPVFPVQPTLENNTISANFSIFFVLAWIAKV